MRCIEMIGSPLGHVRTPDLMNRILRAQHEDICIRPALLDRAGLPAYVARTKPDADVIGLVVTTPLKEAVCDYLDQRTVLARLLGSCNCVRRRDGVWIGANFDGFGFLNALRRSGISTVGTRVLLKGCGGAGKAIAAALVTAGVEELVIDDPRADMAAGFAARLRDFARSCSIVVADERGRFDIIVNASPLGLRGDDPSPVSADLVAECGGVVDIVIGPGESRLARFAREHGKPLITGAVMVHGQVALLHAFLLGGTAGEEPEIFAADALRSGSIH